MICSLIRRSTSLLWAGLTFASFVAFAEPTAPIGGSDAAPKAASEVVLMKGPGGEVTLEQVRAALHVVVPQSQREKFFESPKNIEQLALSVYIRQTLAKQAQAAGIDQLPDVVQMARIAETQFLSDLWLSRQSQAKAPSTEDLEKYPRSIFDAQPPKKSADGKEISFEDQHSALIEQARNRLVNQARADIWNAAQHGAESQKDAIESQVIKSAENEK